MRNEADASNADASSHWCGCDTGLGLGRHWQRGARQRVQKDTGKARKRVYPYSGIDNITAAAASPSLMGSNNNFGGIHVAEFAAKK